MNLKDYCKAGHLVVLNNGLRCLLIPNREGLQLVALGNDCRKKFGLFNTGKNNYVWMSSLDEFDERLKNPLSRHIDEIYGLSRFGAFWDERDRPLLWQRRKHDENRPKDLASNRGE